MNLLAAPSSFSPRHGQDLLWVSARVLTLTESSPAAKAIALPAWPQARRLEFLAGRTLAAAALRQWSFPEVVARRSDGVPLWPPDRKSVV
jgi:4'-phosphopantetheinyl transferase EntD